MEPENREREDSADHTTACRCEHCGSSTRDELVKAAFWSDRGWIAVDGIPARVCQSCLEQFYDQETARKIEKLIANPPVKADEEILVPVFSLADVEIPNTECQTEVLDPDESEANEPALMGTEQAAQDAGATQESGEAHRCHYCQSETDEGVVKSAFWPERGLAVIENIPARVCRRCQEQFYDDQTSWKIARLLQGGFPTAKAHRQIVVQVFSLGENR